MPDSSILVYELVNKYYYEIVSSKVYFGNSIRNMTKGKLFLLGLILLLFLSTILSILLIILNSVNLMLLFKDTLIFNHQISKAIGWVTYVISLLGLFYLLMFVQKKKFEILKAEYGSDRIIRIQEEWIDRNIPADINKMKIINSSNQWLKSHKTISVAQGDLIQPKTFFQGPILSTVVKLSLPIALLSISTMFLGQHTAQDLTKENPTSVLTLIIYMIIIIAIVSYAYVPIKIFLYRMASHIDGKNSKSKYRFDIFNKMLLNHVTLKDLNES